ncbi:hypothetical protein CLCR_11306 [Cladophialophora carrionii]|uniref:Uncharacterized protein n=1 Tax=Cladophialophora carrionii TaxID=86049 RepID=A0A1C1CL85_9EURO|nr:hypothetical protein CLCR_11306 [Cladophialophora carrionii]
MATKKTIMVASLYEFSEVAADELIQADIDAHDDPSTAPFFYFDVAKQTFCAEVDQDDNQTMQNFLTRMAGYIEYQLSIPPALDDEPRIRPLQGTVIEDIIPEDLTEDQALLQYDSDNESSDGDAPQPMQHLTAHWKPRSGNISILPPMYAREIAQLTGSSLFAEEAEKRYRIYQGNFQLALEKLERLEPLLETLAAQTSNWSLRATGNLLVWPPNHQDSKLEYVNMVPDHFSYHRVIVNRQEQTLFSKVLGELRVLNSRTRLLEVPPNLEYRGVTHTVECQASKIWETQQYASFGDPKNMVPIVTSNPGSADNSETGTVKGAHDDRITAWTHNIVPSANPEIAPEAPVEQAPPPRRRVILHSDSEDDEPAPRARKPAPSIVPAATPAPLVQLSDEEDLIEASVQQAFKSAPFLSSSDNVKHNNDTLIDVSEQGSTLANRSSTHAFGALPSSLEEDTATNARQSVTTRTNSIANDGNTGILERMAHSPRAQPVDLVRDQALIDTQAESPAESHEKIRRLCLSEDLSLILTHIDHPHNQLGITVAGGVSVGVLMITIAAVFKAAEIQTIVTIINHDPTQLLHELLLAVVIEGADMQALVSLHLAEDP